MAVIDSVVADITTQLGFQCYLHRAPKSKIDSPPYALLSTSETVNSSRFSLFRLEIVLDSEANFSARLDALSSAWKSVEPYILKLSKRIL